MGVSDANPAGGDSPEVQRLKAQLAELEAREAASAEGTAAPELEANKPVPVEAAAPDQPTDEVVHLQQQLEEQKRKVDELTSQALAQKDPATAVPGVDVKALLNQLVSAQAEYRNEIGALRSELSKVRRSPIPTSTVRALSAEELLAIRLDDLSKADYYCPACGALYKRERECTGKATAPHPAVEVASTAELRDPPDSSDKEAVAEYQAGHTPMQYVDPEVNDQLLG